MYINIKTASKIHPSNSILKCAIIPIIDTEVSFGISFGALSLTTTYSVLNLFINRCVLLASCETDNNNIELIMFFFYILFYITQHCIINISLIIII